MNYYFSTYAFVFYSIFIAMQHWTLCVSKINTDAATFDASFILGSKFNHGIFFCNYFILFYSLITPFVYILHDTAQGDASLPV